MADLKMSNMKINVALLILRENLSEDFFSTLKTFLRTTDLQTFEIIKYLIDFHFVDRDIENSRYKISSQGYNKLQNDNLLHINLKELILEKNNPDFNYHEKLIKYIPNT